MPNMTEAKTSYLYVKCDCGGIIVMKDDGNFRCDKCRKVYRLGNHGDGWDTLVFDDKTGWIFPMVKKE